MSGFDNVIQMIDHAAGKMSPEQREKMARSLSLMETNHKETRELSKRLDKMLASQAYDKMDAYIDAGFTRDEAFEIVKINLQNEGLSKAAGAVRLIGGPGIRPRQF